MLTYAETALTFIGTSLVDDLVESQRTKGLRASGYSAQHTRSVVRRSGDTVILEVIGPDYWYQQQYGRGPVRGKRLPKWFIDVIAEWTAVKGINIPAAAVAGKIWYQGIRVPNAYNPGNVVRDALKPERVLPIMRQRLQEEALKSIQSELFEGI